MTVELKTREQYHDIDFDDKGKVVYDLDALSSKLARLLGTFRNTVPFNRGYGLFLEEYLFQSLNQINANIVLHEVLGTIRQFITGIEIVGSSVTVDYENKTYNLEINFITDYYSNSLNLLVKYDQERVTSVKFRRY